MRSTTRAECWCGLEKRVRRLFLPPRNLLNRQHDKKTNLRRWHPQPRRSPWTLNEWGKCRFCNRIFTGTTDGWIVGNVENLNPVSTALFQEENVFLDHWDETLRKIQSTPTRLS